MFIVGERINGMFSKVKKAIETQDKAPVQELAQAQLDAGADALDVNVGPTSDDPKSVMVWLVETIRETTDAPLSIDSPKFEVLKAGLDACSGRKVINSTTAKESDLKRILPLAMEQGCPVIALCIDENGVPSDAQGRAEVALKIVAAAMEHGIPTENLYIDPVILPVRADQKQPAFAIEAINQFTLLSDPAPHIIVGLSNLSQGTKERKLLNRTFLAMAVGEGLDAAIADPLDRDLMETMITAEVLMNKTIYSDGYLKAYYQK